MGRFQTPHAEITNAACGVSFFACEKSLSKHTEFAEKAGDFAIPS